MTASSIAPLISGWQRRVGGMPGPYSVASASGVASGGTGPNGLMVELLIDGTWVDITGRVLVRDSNGQISITRGQTAEGQQPSPGSCSLQLNNRDGLFSPANAMSPWYGKFGRNTQMRVSVTKGDDKSYRFWGEVTGWPEDWDSTGQDVWVDISASGILTRLSQGQTPLRSTLYRGLTSSATTPPVAYWPCEDGASATSLASALTGGTPMRLVGSPNLSSDNGFLCSAALPVLNGASLVGTIPSYPVTGRSQVRFLAFLPTAPPDGTQIIKVGATGGTIAYWTVCYQTGGALSIRGVDKDGLTILVDSGPITFAIDATRIRVSMELRQTGSSVAWALSVINASTGAISGSSGTFASTTVSRLTTVTVTPGRTNLTGVVGHISVQNDITSVFDLAPQVNAFVGESASTRIGRLCIEQGVNVTTFGAATSSDSMGPQLPNTFTALLQECVDVDQGALFERETAFGLAYRQRSAMYNQNAILTLTYGNQLAAVPKPVPDDQNVRNQWVVSRPNGSSATTEQDSGPLSIQPPPLGVGLYPDSATINVASDDDLLQHGWWRVHLGTVNEPRYPAISVNLAHPAMAGLRLSALNVLFGSRLMVQAPPSRIGGEITQIVIGIQETITHYEHRITYVCQPETPYRAFVLDSATHGRLDTDGSVLFQDLTPTQTTMLVAPIAGPPWTSDPSDMPVNVAAGGEVIRIEGVGTGALNANPWLDVDASGWDAQVNTATMAWSPQTRRDGKRGVMVITPDGVSSSGGAIADRTPLGSITPGASYVVCLWAYSPGGYADLRPAVDWYDSSNTFISSGLGSGFSVPAGAWTFLSQTVVAPAGASMAKMRARHGGTPSSAAVWWAWGARIQPALGPGAVTDNFTRTVSSGWGTATTGQTWTRSGGSASDYSVNGAQGVIALSTVNVSRQLSIPVTAAGDGTADFDMAATMTSPVTSAGASHYLTLTGRYADTSNYMSARVELTTAGAVLLTIRKNLAGSASTLATFTTGLTHTAGASYRIRFAASGSTYTTKVWPAAGTEPDWQVTVTDTDLGAPAAVGVIAVLGSGSTNTLPVNVLVDDFMLLNPQSMTVSRSMNGVVKPHAAGESISLANPAPLPL